MKLVEAEKQTKVISERCLYRVIVTSGNANYTDFNVLPLTGLNFSPGVTECSGGIEIKNDSIKEGDEVLFVSMVSSNGSVRFDKNRGVTVAVANDNVGECIVNLL